MASFNNEAVKKQLRSNFGSHLGDDILEECAQLCQMYNVDGDSLFWTWEALNYGRGPGRQVTLGTVDEIKQKLQKDLQRKQQATKANKPVLPTRNLNGLMRSGGNTNLLSRLGLSTQPKVESQTVGIPSMGESSKSVYRSSVVQFALLSDGSSLEDSRTYRYMYEKTSERSEVLDDRIEDMAQLVKDHYSIPEFSDPSAATEEEVVVIGRITMDSESASAESAKLNEASLTLESSRTTASGVRVPLKFDPGVQIRQAIRGTGGLGFFPGAIVALRGKNGGGGWFYVTEILSLPPLPITEQTSSAKSESFTVHASCGPFSTDVDLQFKPWRAVVQKLNVERPQVVLLLGPFLDSNHPSLRRGDIESSPSEIFRQTFVEPLQAYIDSNPGALILIVPSVRDVLSDHAVFPQAQFTSDLFNDPRILLLPNPCRFTLNDISFAVTSVDVLFHLRKEEFVKRAVEVESSGPEGVEIPVDPMANLCRHVIQQRSFYPLFPTPTDLAHEVNLDITHSDFLSIPQRPDVLIVPSRLRQFTKTLEGTVAANPSFATKGTYATFHCTNGSSQGDAKVQAEISKLDA